MKSASFSCLKLYFCIQHVLVLWGNLFYKCGSKHLALRLYPGIFEAGDAYDTITIVTIAAWPAC